ncbi:MAG: hypothetical protein AB7O62_15070 [Pirellulales bacterium]
MVQKRAILGVVLLLAAALAVRVGLVLALHQGGAKPFSYEHGEIARNLVQGRGFTVTYLGHEGPTSQQAPLYPLLLAGLYRVWGVESPAALLAMQLLQCLAGAGLALAVAWLGWSLLPLRPLVGWLAGWCAALYPTHIYMVTHIQVAVWAALLLTLTAAVAASNLRHRALLAGLLGGLLLLVEPILALALPILAWSMFPRADPRPDSTDGRGFYRGWLMALRGPALFAAVSALVVAPWLWRNARVHGEFVFVKSSFGYALWQGNNAQSWGTDKIPKPAAATLLADHDGSLRGVNAALWNARHETIYIDDLLLVPGGYREFAGLSEPARSRLLGQQAKRFIRENPGDYARLCAQRLRYFLTWDETNPKAAHPLYRAATLAWLCLSLIGLCLAGRHWRALWPGVGIFCAVALFHTLTIVSARFRIPVEPLTFVWMGIALAARSRTAPAVPA